MIFFNSVSSAAALVFYLPGVCTHTDIEGKQRKARVRNIFKDSEKNTIFNEHPVVQKCTFVRIGLHHKSVSSVCLTILQVELNDSLAVLATTCGNN